MTYKLLLLLALFLISNANHFSDDLYPKELTKAEYRQQCPIEYHKMSHCIPKYEDCIGTMMEVKECNMQFQKCTEIPLEGPIDEDFELDDCSNYTTNAVFYVWTHGASIQKSILKLKKAPVIESIQKRLQPMQHAFHKVQKECGIESRLKNEMNRFKKSNNMTNSLMNIVLPYFTVHLVELSMLKRKTCRLAIEELEKVMETTDMVSAENLHLPYEFWHMATAFGPIGKVPFRVIADEVCGKATLEMNHQSVVHVNCYDQQLSQRECDENYLDGIEIVLSTMESSKLTCKMYTDLVKMFLPLRAAQFYKEAPQFVSDSKMLRVGEKFNRGFSGFVNGSLTRRDTKNTFVKLEASAETPLRLLDYYDHVSSECGPSRRSAGIISSCGFLYEYCTHFVKNGCHTKLAICLNTIDNMTESCQAAVSRINNFLWPTVPQQGSVSRESVDSHDYMRWGVVGVATFFIISSILLFVFYKRQSSKKSPSVSSDSIEMNTVLVDNNRNGDNPQEDIENRIIELEEPLVEAVDNNNIEDRRSQNE